MRMYFFNNLIRPQLWPAGGTLITLCPGCRNLTAYKRVDKTNPESERIKIIKADTKAIISIKENVDESLFTIINVNVTFHRLDT